MENLDPLSADAWRARINECKRERRQLVQAWSENVDYRRGKPFAQTSDQDRINVNLDHPYTRAKHAQLFSQVPSVVLTTDRDDLQPVVGSYSSRLNKELTRASVGAAVDESVIDCINASGVGAVLVSYEERREKVPIPAVDKITAGLLRLVGKEVPSVESERVTDRKFSTTHLSPDDLLWSLDWAGSDFDQAPWIGRTGRMFWPEAKAAFKLKDEDRDKVCGGDAQRDRIRNDDEHTTDAAIVEFDEVFFRLAQFKSDAKYFSQIQRLVFVNGIDNPVVDEPAKHQKFDPATGQYFGSCKYPIQVLTLDYISDDAIPPSDSAIARPQVNELIEHRTQTILNRKRSIPLRWHDVNRVDPLTSSNLMRGTWQASIPVKGSGDAIMGEVARAAYPADDYRGADIAMRDAALVWGAGPNQAGTFASGERSATEAAAVQQANNSQIGYQRARVARFFCSIAEVFSGLLALYGDLPFENAEALASEFAYTIRPDSTVLLDSQQRTRQLAQFLNLTANSGFINPEPVIREMCALNNVDPAKVMVQPHGKTEQPNISYRFNGQDLVNPLAYALLMEAGQAPSPQSLEAAKQAILAAQQPAQPVSPQPAQPPLPDRIGPGIDRITKRQDEV